MRHLLVFVLLALSSFAFAIDIPMVTYNVHKSSADDPISWEERGPDIIELLYPYQITALQEVTPLVLNDLLEGLPEMKAVAQWKADGSDGGVCSPILYNSKEFLLLHEQSNWLHITPQNPTEPAEFSYSIALFQHVKTGDTYRVVNAYLPRGDYYNKEEAIHILRSHLIISSSDYNFLMGCFNVEPDSPTHDYLSNTTLGDAFEISQNQCRTTISTYNTFEPDNKVHMVMDYIFTDHPHVFWACIEERLKFGFYLSNHIPFYLLIRE